jgi:aspartate racemase
MKKIGLVGGVGWPSTVDYYSGLCRRAEAWHRALRRTGPPAMPEIAIESLDLARAVSLLGREDDEASWRAFDEYHRSALQRLEAGGAEIAAIASHTAHHRFDTIVRGARIPVVNIIEETARECVRAGVRRLLLLGTALTMRSARIRDGFARFGLEAFAPPDEATRAGIELLIAALQTGRANDAAGRLHELVRRSIGPGSGDPPAVGLACTELPLAFGDSSPAACFTRDGIRYLNASAVHVNALFQRAGADAGPGA